MFPCPMLVTKKEAQRIQHASQEKLSLVAMAPEEDDLECLGVGNGDAIWKQSVDKHLQVPLKRT